MILKIQHLFYTFTLAVLSCTSPPVFHEFDLYDQVAEAMEPVTNYEVINIHDKNSTKSKVIDFQFESADSSDYIIFKLTKNTKYKANSLEKPDRVYIDFINTFSDQLTNSLEFPGNEIRRIRSAPRPDGSIRYVIDCAVKTDFHVHPNPDKKIVALELIPSVRKPLADHSVADNSDGVIYLNKRPAVKTETSEKTLAKELGIKYRTIIIDPGHGGKDPGCISQNGIQEKDITLDIACRLKKLSDNDKKYRALLTRDKDQYIHLEDRTTFANRNGGDLFVSIHVNAHESPEKNGIETYYLSLAEDEHARAVAEVENQSARNTYRQLNELIEKIMSNSKIEESREFASLVQRTLIARTARQDRGIKKAGFVVLVGASMPSVLVEVEFLSNPKGAELVQSKFYREMVAEALYEAIQAFADQPLVDSKK